MNILIVNQPLNNRGDEAAHRSLLRALSKRYCNDQIIVLILGEYPNSVEQFDVKLSNVKYINIRSWGAIRIIKYVVLLNIERIISYLHPSFYKITSYVKNADLVVCAPGGICMGEFQNWGHIFFLYIAMIYKKKVAYYSRSFGHFPTKTWSNRRFKKISESLLHYFDFLSIRDSKTMRIADELNVTYVPAIDTAFLDTPIVALPNSIESVIADSKFVVFVPNALTWHPAFKNNNQNKIDSFYVNIIDILLKKYADCKIIMVPQLFNAGMGGDELYFQKLKERVNDKRIVIISEQFGSDIQQTIISKAEFIIGSRYHTIVFGINNMVPFMALSYEHKVSGLLDILGKSDCMIDITKLGSSDFDSQRKLKKIETFLKSTQPDEDAKNKAKKIAEQCFDVFLEKYGTRV